MKRALLTVVAIFALAGCGGNTGTSTMLSKNLPSSTSVPTCVNVAMAPSYAAMVAPILANNCVACHSNFNSYAGASPNATLMSLEVRTFVMPPVATTAITTTERTTIEQWAACGAKP